MSVPPEFHERDPTLPQFWDERFAAGFVPWDAGGVPRPFERWLNALGPGGGRRVLIPGCGAAYEAAALDAAGFAVTAIDYAPAALARARQVLGTALADRCLQQANFFAFEESPFDHVYERAFLAALPPALWPQWAARLACLLAPGATLAGLFVIEPELPHPRRGPPFATSVDELQRLLGAAFALEIVQAVPAGESLPVLAGREHWLQWRRRVANPPMAHRAPGEPS